MTTPAASPLRVASVSYLNSKPLIYGLERIASPRGGRPEGALFDVAKECPCGATATREERYDVMQPALDRTNAIQLSLEVPSRLIDGLAAGRSDVALLPVIDYQRHPGLVIVPSGGIGCDGPTLTVRIFSKRPIAETKVLACDPDSHTSVALARIIFAEHYGIHPEFVDLARSPSETRLLIGDKVVCEEPAGFEHQLDLGAAWKEMTGMPFVFAVWVARAGIPLGDLPLRLEQSKRDGLAHVDELVQQYALPRGWPADLARQYMTEYLKYDIADPQFRAISTFHELAARHGLVSKPVQPLRMYHDGR